MAKVNRIDDNNSDLLARNHGVVRAAFRLAVRDALLKHKRNGNTVAVVRNGSVVVLHPDEIRVS
jgi:hypothetical protein